MRLLRQVMDAVEYAHANLVVHRDLKPGNVLATAEGEAKLLDFGIAKLMEDETGGSADSELTRVGGRALTLRYAAPELIGGAAVSTAVDIWALGVLLYELLPGLLPFGGDGSTVVEHDILSRDPTRPSQRRSGAIATLSRSSAGDLATIVLKALKKNPAERYATVGAFADDLDRWLRGEPVRAQRDSAWYRTRRFVGRHKLVVSAAALAVAAVTGTAFVAVVQGLQAREQSARALAARDFMMDIFRRADPTCRRARRSAPSNSSPRAIERCWRPWKGNPCRSRSCSGASAGPSSAWTTGRPATPPMPRRPRGISARVIDVRRLPSSSIARPFGSGRRGRCALAGLAPVLVLHLVLIAVNVRRLVLIAANVRRLAQNLATDSVSVLRQTCNNCGATAVPASMPLQVDGSK